MADQDVVRQIRKEMGLSVEAETSLRTSVESLKSKTGDVKAFSDELKKMLGEATLSNMSNLDASTQMSISQLVIGVAREMDKTASILNKLDAYNAQEIGIIEASKDAVKQAEAVLTKAQRDQANKGWFMSIFVDYEANVKKAEEALETAKKLVPLSEKRALEMREARQQKATSEENIKSLVSYSEAAVEVLDELFAANMEKLGVLEEERTSLQKKYETSEKQLKKLRSDTSVMERKIQKAQEELDGLPTEEVAQKKGELGVLQIELEKLRSAEREQLSNYMSAEKLTTEHLIQIKSTQLTNAVIRSLQNTIRTETESRIKSFDMALQQLKNGQALRVASVMNDSSNAMAIQLSKVSLSVAVSAQKEFRKNLEEHPQLIAKQEVMNDEMNALANELLTDIETFNKQQQALKKNRPKKGDMKKQPDPADDASQN